MILIGSIIGSSKKWIAVKYQQKKCKPFDLHFRLTDNLTMKIIYL